MFILSAIQWLDFEENSIVSFFLVIFRMLSYYIYRMSHQYCPARDQDFWYKGATQEFQLNTSCTKTLVFSWSERKFFAEKLYAERFFNIGRKKPQICFFTFSLLLQSTPWLYIDQSIIVTSVNDMTGARGWNAITVKKWKKQFEVFYGWC